MERGWGEVKKNLSNKLNFSALFCLTDIQYRTIMKKILTILCIALAAVTVTTVSSCKKEYITQASPNQTILFNVPTTAWTLSSDGKSYYTVISTPEIDSYFNDYGGVLAYISLSTGVYEQIPEVYNGVSYSYTHNAGAVVIYAQSYDGTTPVQPAALVFKLLLLSSSN